jgi:outer membrane protein
MAQRSLNRGRRAVRAKKTLSSLVSLLAMGGVAAAADLTSTTPPPPAPVAAPSPFFVKFGFTYVINDSTSKLYSQIGVGSAQYQVPGVGANIANVATVGFEAGYYVMPNISLDISGGVPMWAKVTTKGSPPPGGLPPNGTELSSFMPAFVPITVLYHFTQFGALQPYLGAGVAPTFSFGQKDAFNTGVTVDPSLGFVLQAGADYMLDNHWGLSLDVKRLWVSGESHATGDNLAVLGAPYPPITVPYAATLKTQFDPWTLSTGVVYRF